MDSGTILVVEDNPMQQEVVKHFLEAFDYKVILLKSGEEALEAMAMTNDYAAILMDLSLPGISGIECARQLREFEKSHNLKPTPIIAVTANHDARGECMDAGMDAYLSKPFSTEELRKVLLCWTYRPSSPNLKLLKSYSDKLSTDDHSNAG